MRLQKQRQQQPGLKSSSANILPMWAQLASAPRRQGRHTLMAQPCKDWLENIKRLHDAQALQLELLFKVYTCQKA